MGLAEPPSQARKNLRKHSRDCQILDSYGFVFWVFTVSLVAVYKFTNLRTGLSVRYCVRSYVEFGCGPPPPPPNSMTESRAFPELRACWGELRAFFHNLVFCSTNLLFCFCFFFFWGGGGGARALF